MRKFIKVILCLLVVGICFTSCFKNVHTVGQGSQFGVEESKKQWYALYGLIPLNNVDSKNLAVGASDYTITTSHTFVDLVISFFTSIGTVNVTTVKVSK